MARAVFVLPSLPVQSLITTKRIDGPSYIIDGHIIATTRIKRLCGGIDGPSQKSKDSAVALPVLPGVSRSILVPPPPLISTMKDGQSY